MDNIRIAGKSIRLERPTTDISNMLWLGLLAEFDIYQFAMNDSQLLLLCAKENTSYPPLQRSKIAQRIEALTQIPAVFYSDNMPTYERDRLVNNGVYFVVSDKFAYLPTLLSNRRLSSRAISKQLLPSTQYLLLLHLQQNSLDGKSLNDIAEITPYKYATIAKSVQQLNALGLVELSIDSSRRKRLHFMLSNHELWERAQSHLINPIKQIGYLAEPLKEGFVGGVEALSYYSMLAGEDVPTKIFTLDEAKRLGLKTSLMEDLQRIEVWKYPPIASDGYVDKLSLYLTLKDDTDPRVEKELETIINEMPW